MTSLTSLTLQEICTLATPTVFARGREYHQRSAVIELTRTDSGTLWARVQGTEPRPYSVTVAPVGPTGLLWECTCPHFRNREGEACKHVIAVLLAWLSRRDRTAARAQAPIVRPPRRPSTWTPTWSPKLFSAP